MKLKKVNEFVRYQEITNLYKRKGCLTNDYLYNDAAYLINQGRLLEFCGKNNAFLFVKKYDCLRVYYYLNDLTETYDFDLDENLVVEILFRGNHGIPVTDISFLTRCGFNEHLRRDQYCGIYKDLQTTNMAVGVFVQKAKDLEEIRMACDLFNNSFDRFSGDYIDKDLHESLYENGSIWVAKDSVGNFAGALHQTIENGVAWISHVSVLQAFRGRGVGQALLNRFVEQNHKDDKSRYMLWVQAKNEPAVRMYQKNGFKYIGKSTISMIKLNNKWKNY